MENHYYNSKDLSKFGNISEYQKPLADKFLDGTVKHLKKMSFQQKKNL